MAVVIVNKINDDKPMFAYCADEDVGMTSNSTVVTSEMLEKYHDHADEVAKRLFELLGNKA